MKILNKPLLFLMLFGLSFIMTNCERETTENNTTTASFNSFDELVQGRLSSIYATLRSNAVYRQGGILGTWSDVGIDTHSGTLFPVEYNPLYAYTYSSGSLLIGQTWTEYYIAIKQINTFLGQVSTFEDTSTLEERNPVIAEARFLRALFYFDLVKIWGNVPLVVNEGITLDVVKEDANLPNSTAAEVYLQIIEDLEFAKANGASRVGSRADIASREAAQALLGKVYLQMTTTEEFGGVAGGIDASGGSVSIAERFTMAERELSAIITSGAFALEPNYADVFANEDNNEVIFSVGYDGPNNQVGGDFGDFLGEGNIRDGGSFAAYRANIDFALEFLRPDGLVDPDDDGSTISPSNLLPAVNSEFIDVATQNFKAEVLLLGPDHFVADERWSQNIARFDPSALANILRGNTDDTELNRYNLNLDWTRWSPYKYIKPIPNPNSPGDGTIDFPYLRYADILLMEAEALNALGRTDDAKTYVNMVIRRSIKDQILTSIPEFEDPNATPPVAVEYIVPTQNTSGTLASTLNTAINNNLVPTDINNYLLEDGLSQDEMLDAIVLERNKELCYEGKRKDDLIRTGKLDDIINALHVNSVNIGSGNQIPIKQAFELAKHVHWPIPQEEIILNPNLQQNCEYGSSPAGCF